MDSPNQAWILDNFRSPFAIELLSFLVINMSEMVWIYMDISNCFERSLCLIFKMGFSHFNKSWTQSTTKEFRKIGSSCPYDIKKIRFVSKMKLKYSCGCLNPIVFVEDRFSAELMKLNTTELKIRGFNLELD